MTFLLLNLLQPHTPLPWSVIIGAALAFIAGVWLLVYFYRRYKRIEKESEEDWDSSRRSLFVNAAPSVAKVDEPSAPASVEVETPITEEEEAPVLQGATREFASDVDLASFAPATIAKEEPRVETAAFEEPAQPEAPPPPLTRATEILASPALVEAVAETEAVHEAPFDEDVWASLEIAEQPPLASEHEIAARSNPPEPLSVARVEQPSRREPFEPPRIQRISNREPYEPPSIEPLTPREAAATRELRSARPPQIEQTREDLGQARSARETGVIGSSPQVLGGSAPVEPRRVESGTSELAAESSLWKSKRITEPSIAGGYAHKAPPGSILGLPAEYSNQPLILGEPARPADETGIGALTHYGQDLGPKGGRAGTIALLIVVTVFVGAVGLYFFVPSVHSRVGVFVGRLRGSDAQVAREAAKPKAQVIPSTRPEVNKNMVTARGAVLNISDEPIENLTVEVSLQRGGDAAPETRTVPVTPNSLQPTERGTFEFEYDGKRDTGFAGYTITRLFSNGTGVRFSAPGQK